MSEWKEELTAIAKRYIETEKACRANPCGWQSCPPRDTPVWKEYAILRAAWQEAEKDLWQVTDIEYDDKDLLRATCWEWRYWKVMARKCSWYQLNRGNTDEAAYTMQKLHNAEAKLMELCGVKDFYKFPCQYLEEAFPGLKKGI